MRNGRHRNEPTLVQEFMDDLFRTTRGVLTGALFASLKEAVEGLIHRSLRTLLVYLIGGVLIGFGLVLVLLGGFQALRLIPLPDAAAYAIMGLVGVGAGLIAIVRDRTKERL